MCIKHEIDEQRKASAELYSIFKICTCRNPLLMTGALLFLLSLTPG